MQTRFSVMGFQAVRANSSTKKEVREPSVKSGATQFG
jgi:hypothetical protein